jgi:hypothetical protein
LPYSKEPTAQLSRVGLPLTPWINYIAGFGAIVLTFLAGTDIDPHVVKRNFGFSVTFEVGNQVLISSHRNAQGVNILVFG